MASHNKKSSQNPVSVPGIRANAAPSQKLREESNGKTKKRVDARFVLISSGVLVALAVGIHLVHAVQVGRNAVHLKDRALAAEAEGDWGKAAQLYGQYLSLEEDDLETRLHALQLRDGLATNARALHNVMLGYEEVLRRDPNRSDETDIRRDLVAVAMVNGQYSIAIHHLKSLLTEDRYRDFRDSDPARLAELYFQEGQCHQIEGRAKEALDSYSKALKKKRDEHKYYLPLAVLFSEQHASLPRQEETELTKDVPEQIVSLLPLSNKATFDGKLAANRVLEWMIQEASHPAKAYLARAQWRTGQKELAEARSDVEQSRTLKSDDRDLLLFSAQLAVEQANDARLHGKASEFHGFLTMARKDVEQGLAAQPQAADFYLIQLLIENETREGLRLLPDEEKQEVSSNCPDELKNPHSRLQWTSYEKAETILQKGLDAVEKSLKDLESQKPERTRLRLENSARPLSRYQLFLIGSELKWWLADNRVSKHELLIADLPKQVAPESTLESLKNDVNEQIGALQKMGAPRGMLQFLEARLLLVEGHWKEAAWALEQTRLSMTERKAVVQRIDLLLDQCYKRLGNPDQRLEVADRALSETPNWIPAIVKLAEIYQSTNRTEHSLKAYERLQGVPGASLPIAQLRLQSELSKPLSARRWDSIYQALDSAKEESPDDLSAISILMAEVLSSEATQLAEQGQDDEAQKKSEQATKELDEAIEKAPKNPELRAARSLLELKLPWPKTRTREERIQSAAAILDKAISELGDHLPLRTAAVQIGALLPAPEALEELSALSKQPALSAVEQPQFLEGMARAHALVSALATDQKDKDLALERVLEYQVQAAALRSDEIAPQIMLAELAYDQKQSGPIRSTMERVEKIEGPNGANGNYLKALETLVGIEKADTEKIAKARRLLTQALRDRPFWATLPRALGDLEWGSENRVVAMTHYEKAYELGDRSSKMIARMLAYYESHQKRSQVDNLVSSVSLDMPILLTGELAQWKWRTDFLMRGASKFHAHSNDYQDHLMEGNFRLSQRERGEPVLASFLKARELARDKPEVWLSLVNYYVRIGDLKTAQETISEAQMKGNLPTEPRHQRDLTIAQCYDIVNDRAQAEQHYQIALKLAADFSPEAKAAVQLTLSDFYTRSRETDLAKQQQSRDQSYRLLDEILDPEQKGIPQSFRDLARRRKALLLASTRQYADTERALELLLDGRTGRELDNDDLRAQLSILRIRNRFQDRLGMITVLETLESREVLSADERLLLARCYEITDHWPEAAAQFQILLKDIGPELKTARAKVLADYALALLYQTKNVDETLMLAEATTLIAELERLEPKSLRSRSRRARLLYRQGKGSQAVKLLKDYMDSFSTHTPEQAFRDLVEHRNIAEALESLQKLLSEKEAIEMIDQVRQLVVLGQQDEAVSVMKLHIGEKDLVANVQTSLVRVIARYLEELEQYPHAEEAFDDYAKRSKQPEAVLELAAFLARRNRIDEALQICESAWKNCNPQDVARVSVGTLRSAGKPTAAQIQRVESYLTDALEEATPEHWTQLVTTFADLRDLQGRHDESSNIYREMLKRDPRNATALNNLAWLLSYQSQARPEAESLIERAITLYGPIGPLLDTRGMVYLRRGEVSKALKDLKQAAIELPIAPTYFHLAQAHLAAGDEEAAEAAYLAAIKDKNLDPIKDLHVLEMADYERMKEMFE